MRDKIDMRMATWNVERLAHKKNLGQMLSECSEMKADIFVLTETDERMRPEYKHCFSTLRSDYGNIKTPSYKKAI